MLKISVIFMNTRLSRIIYGIGLFFLNFKHGIVARCNQSSNLSSFSAVSARVFHLSEYLISLRSSLDLSAWAKYKTGRRIRLRKPADSSKAAYDAQMLVKSSNL